MEFHHSQLHFLESALVDSGQKGSIEGMYQALQYCVWEGDLEMKEAISHCLSELLLITENFAKGWVLESINEWDMVQERVVFLTNEAIYRVKYDFTRKEIISHTRTLLQDITLVEYGCFTPKPKTLTKLLRNKAISSKYGIRLYTRLRDGNRGFGPKKRYYRTYRPVSGTLAIPNLYPYEVVEMVSVLKGLSALLSAFTAAVGGEPPFQVVETENGLMRPNKGGVVSMLYNKVGRGRARR
eukprot:GCRY01001902.1.p1 GENE.GCRY01001902.1~~GCRY01001902.1.p1  ORF type:complete len:240 (+),score=44.12 GCRY01001902.1:362-1081(+)